MTRPAKNSKLKFLTNNWVGTLSATLIVVFAALYLNELVAERKIENQKSIATKNILSELMTNSENFTIAVNKHSIFYDIMVFMDNYSDSESGGFIAPIDSLNKFRRKHPKLITVKDSVQVSRSVYQYSNGEINFDFSIPQFEITTIAWKTLKSSGISQSFNFKCLMYLEGIYNITNKVSTENEILFDEVIEYLGDEENTKEKRKKLIGRLQLLISYEESLIKMYESSEKELKTCC